MPVRQMLRRIKQASLLRTAVHEAGHAVLCVHYGFPILQLNITHNKVNQRDGLCRHLSLGNPPPFNGAVISWGGEVAVNLIIGMSQAEADTMSSNVDFLCVDKAIVDHCKKHKLKYMKHFDKLSNQIMERAFSILGKKENRNAVILVAEALVQKGKLDNKSVVGLVYKAKGIKAPAHLLRNPVLS